MYGRPVLDAFFATLAVALEFLGAGLLVDLLPLPKTTSAPGAMVRGVLALAAGATALNLIVPLDGVVTRTSWAVAALALAFRWRRARELLGTRWPVALAGFLGLALIVSASAVVRGPEYDTGLYHQQTMLWLSTSATPAGLANLHYRLGYSSVWHPLAALVDAGAEPFALGFAANAALLTSVVLGLIGQAAAGPRGDPGHRAGLPGVACECPASPCSRSDREPGDRRAGDGAGAVDLGQGLGRGRRW